MYDLILKGGRIYDGSGMPSFIGDVAINDGRIEEIGRINAAADRVIDVGGLAVAPGIIDFHTHFDAQLCASRGHAARKLASRNSLGMDDARRISRCARAQTARLKRRYTSRALRR